MTGNSLAVELMALEGETFEITTQSELGEDLAAWCSSSCSTTSCCSCSCSSCCSTSSCSSCQSTSQ